MIKQKLSSISVLRRLAFVTTLISAFAVMVCPVSSFAQQDAADEMEKFLSKEEQEVPIENTPSAASDAKSYDIKELSDLEKLSEFRDIVVIQKRYQPKTGRFELFGGPSVVLNDKFFLNFGLNGRFSYYFREQYGLEFVAMYLTTSERQVTKDLREKRDVTTTSFLTPKSYLGLDFKWVPVYGKMTWKNRTITPFDLYFSIGGGTTGTNQGTSEPTLHLGTGQSFALSKSTALRWDFSWNFFSAQSKVSGGTSSANYNNLFITVGMSFFFPEASYR